MFDLDQTFSLNILPYKQMFDRLAISAKTACVSGKSNQSKTDFGIEDVFFQR